MITIDTKQIHEERLLAEFERLVSFDSESFHERELREYLQEKLLALGLDVEEDDAAEKLRSFGAETGNLYGFLGGTRPGQPLLFSAHLDTVSPGIGKRAVFHDDGSIRSDGTTVLGADDAAGLAAILEALTVIQEKDLPHPDLEILFPVAEERYGRGSAVFDYSMLRAKEAYVLDLTGAIGTAALRAPSILSVDIRVQGRSSHAGFSPEAGVNALSIAAKALSELETGHVNADTTVNFGLIEGGEGRNIVPGTILIRGEIRSLRHEEALEQGRKIRACFQREAERRGGTAEALITEEIRAYAIQEDEPVVRRFQRAADEAGLTCRLTDTFGGSDNNNFALHGIRGIVLACGMHNVHSVGEYTTREELIKTTELTLRLMTMEGL